MGIKLKFYISRSLLIVILVLAAGVIFLPVEEAQAAGPVLLESREGGVALAPHLEYLEDKGRELSFEQVSSPGFDNRFAVYGKDILTLGVTRWAHWFRFKLKPGPWFYRGGSWFLELDKPGIARIELYIPVSSALHDGNPWLIKRSGSSRPASARDLPFRTFIFTLPHDFDPDRWFYFCLEATVALNMAVTLFTPKELAAQMIPDSLGFGIIYGVLIAMALYNMFLFLGLKDRVYVYYVLYIVSMTLYLCLLYGHISSLVDLGPGLETRILYVLVGLVVILAAQFARVFLDSANNIPLLDKLMLLFMGLGLVEVVLGGAGLGWLANRLANFLSLAGGVLYLAAPTVCLVRGFRPARFFLVAWAMLTAGAVLYTLAGNILPRNPVTLYTFAVGAAIEAVLLSLALADRIRIMRHEREMLQKVQGRFRRLSETDELTGLYNLRYIRRVLTASINRQRSLGQPLSLLMMDVDDFKRFNDAFGHPEGDKVLEALGRVIRQDVREQDHGCRYGGEEFAAILPGVGAGEAFVVAERIREHFREIVFFPPGGEEVRVSISLGLAELAEGEGADSIIERADRALYQAKREGKDRTVTA